MKVGMTKEQWNEAVEGFGSETVKTYSLTTNDDVTKQITLASPNVMGAMCAYCHAGPMKLTNLYSNHYSKNKCPKLVNTLGKYMKKTKSQMDKDERKMKAKGKPMPKSIATGKTEEAKDVTLIAVQAPRVTRWMQDSRQCRCNTLWDSASHAAE